MDIHFNFEIGVPKKTNTKYVLAKEASDYFAGKLSVGFMLNLIKTKGEAAVRREFEASKKGREPYKLFLSLIKKHKIDYLEK